MKRLMLGISLLFLASQARAGLFELTRDDSVLVTYTTPSTSASTAAIVIDLSDSTNFPHKRTGSINISAIRVDIDRVATATGTVKLGVVVAVNASTGTVRWFWIKNYSKNYVSTPGADFMSTGSGVIRTQVVDGVALYLLSSLSDSLSTTWQTDVVLPTPTGTHTAPGVGDIVTWVNGDATNATQATFHILYSSER
jgi:hypothetical protein